MPSKEDVIDTARQLVRDGSVGMRKCHGETAQVEMLRSILWFAAHELSRIEGDRIAAETAYQVADEIAVREAT